MSVEINSRFYNSEDGLRLHCLDVAPQHDRTLTPVVCLPGLTRGAGDFDVLARALACSSAHPRRVIAFDYRGRGLSDHDPDWHYYDLATERDDFLKGLDELGIGRAHFVGASRGGLHVMALAATHRDRIHAVVLNDIGPKIEAEGLQRIKGYVGTMVQPRSIDEAIKLLKIGSGLHFDGLTAEEWHIFATTTFGTDQTKLGLRYDPQLARTLDAFDLSKPLPESWDLFDVLAGHPVLTIRGERSDLLSAETFAAMGARWPESETFVVPGQGHAPLLVDAPTIGRITDFLARADGVEPPR